MIARYYTPASLDRTDFYALVDAFCASSGANEAAAEQGRCSLADGATQLWGKGHSLAFPLQRKAARCRPPRPNFGM